METETEVKTFRVHLKCPDCDKNMMLECNGNYMKGGKNIYKCSLCQITHYTSKKYPYIKYG